MRNRVKIIESKFHLDTENKVVVCELKCDMQMEKHPAWYVICNDMWDSKFPKVKGGVFTVKAVARCNSTDIFNVETGKRIAESRAKAKMFNISSRIYELCSDALTKFANECTKSAVACEQAMMVENNHVLELTR